MDEMQTDLTSDPPYYSPISRNNSEMSAISNSSVPSEADGNTSSQLEQASEHSDRVPTEDDLESDNWKYLKDFLVVTQTPVGQNRN